MQKVNATLNVLAELIVSGEATDPLVEHLEMRGIANDARRIDLFDREIGPGIFVETREYLECDLEDLFLTRDMALKRIFNWVKARKGRDCRLSCSMIADASMVAYKLHVALEDRSALRVRMEFDMRDPKHPEFLKCNFRLRRSNANYFISPFEAVGDMRQAPTAFLQCIRECAEYERIECVARAVLQEGFIDHVCKLPVRRSAWKEESHIEWDEQGRSTERKVRLAAYGEEYYEYELNERDEECMTLRCGKYFKCMYRRKCDSDYRLAEIVFKGQLEEGPKTAGVSRAQGDHPISPSKDSSPQSVHILAQKDASGTSAASKKRNKDSSVVKTRKVYTKLGSGSDDGGDARRQAIVLKEKDTLARSSSGSPETHVHGTERVTVAVEVRRSSHRSEIREVTAYRCRKCGLYLLSGSAYSILKEGGRFICCKVVEVDDAGNSTESKRKSGERYLEEESLLHCYGYNVGKKDNLTPEQRQMILSFVVDRGIMKPREAIGFLRYLVERAKPRKADMSSAISNWEDDIRFLERLGKGSSSRGG